MKKIITLMAIFPFLFIFTGCGSRSSQSANNADRYYEQVLNGTAAKKDVEKTSEKALASNKELESWAKEGVECYGIIVATDAQGKAQYGKPVKSKIILIENGRYKMKSLESVNIGAEKGCSKMNIPSGTTWWEEDGQLFQDKQGAIDFLEEKGLLK